ncbi:MAG: site-2 protease family protein, partial [Pirellulales bacterium]
PALSTAMDKTVISAEPPRTAYDLNFQVARFPVRVHPFFWLAAILLSARRETPPWVILLWICVVFISILIHELGHALAFRYFGRDCHIVLHMLGGLAVPDERFGGFEPYRTQDDSDSASQIIISLAGPAAGFLFAALIAAAIYLSGYQFEYVSMVGSWLSFEVRSSGPPIDFEKLKVCLLMLFDVNIIWGLVNLLPVFPLDGGQVSKELFEKYRPHDGLRQSLVVSIAAAIFVAAVGLLKYNEIFIAVMFGVLAYINYRLLQQLSGGGYGDYGDRGW